MPRLTNANYGTVHIKLPFTSLDDIEFSGAYAPVADTLMDTLKEHLSKYNGSQDDSDDSEPDEGSQLIKDRKPLLNE